MLYLLLKQFLFEVFFVDNSVYHDKLLPKLDTGQCHFRIRILNRIYENLEVKTRLIGLDHKVGLLSEDVSNAVNCMQDNVFLLWW